MPVKDGAFYRTDEEKLEVYRHRINQAEEFHQKWAKDADELVARYRGQPKLEDFTLSGHRIAVPTGPAVIDSMFSALTAVDVEVTLQPQALGSMEQARIGENAIMATWNDAKVSRKSRDAIKDALIAGIGWVKVGYEYAERLETRDPEPEEIEARVEAIFEVAGDDIPDAEEVAEASIQPIEEVVVDIDRVVVDYIHWKDVFWDPSAKQRSDIRYMIQSLRLPRHEVVGNEDYREYVKQHGGSIKALEELEPDALIDKTARGKDYDETNPHEDDRRMTIYLVYDLESGTVCTVPKAGNFLLNEQPIPFAFHPDFEDRNPFVPLVLRTNPDHVRGISDMELMLPSLNELNRYRSVLLNYLERHVPKVVFPARSLGAAGKAAFESKEMEAVELEEGFDGSQIKQIDPPTLPQEAFSMVEKVENQIREATGVSELMRGIFPDRKRTATETAEVVAASSARQSEKRSLMEDFYTNIAKRIFDLLMIFPDTPVLTRTMEEFGDVVWEWTPEDITMEADLQVVLSPKQPKDPEWRRQQAMEMVNFFGALPGIDQKALAKHAALAMGWDFKVVREILMLPEEEQQQKMEELQDEANRAVAGEGVPPTPDAVPGPMAGAELGAAVNPGELPPELLATTGVMGDIGEQETGPLDWIAGP
jgi:hypothetical protein